MQNPDFPSSRALSLKRGLALGPAEVWPAASSKLKTIPKPPCGIGGYLLLAEGSLFIEPQVSSEQAPTATPLHCHSCPHTTPSLPPYPLCTVPALALSGLPRGTWPCWCHSRFHFFRTPGFLSTTLYCQVDSRRANPGLWYVYLPK